MSRRLSTLVALFFLSSIAALPATLTVAAASDLAAIEPDLATAFRKIEPTADIHFITGASGVLAQQIANGAPYDVFLSANASFLDGLTSSGPAVRKIEPKTVQVYALGRLGILWKDDKSHPLSYLKDETLRLVALPNPKLAPYGLAAEQALRHEGLWNFVRSKVVYGENVRQTLQLFESGNADAVITADSLLGGKHPDLIPAKWHDPIVQKAGVIVGTKEHDLAVSFMRFLGSPAAQALFARFGFMPSDANGHTRPAGP